MKVLFIPFYSENPYQNNLTEALKDKGVILIPVTYVPGQIFPVLRAAIANWKPDIIHLHWTDRLLLAKNRPLSILKSLRFTLELCLLKMLGVQLVWTVHNLFNHEKKDSNLEKYFHHYLCTFLYDKIIVMTAYGIEAIVKAYQLPQKVKNKIRVIPHGHYINNYRNRISKFEARDKLGISNEATVFLYFGIIRHYKGVFHLIKEFLKMLDKKVMLLVCGKPSTNALKIELKKACVGYQQIQGHLRFIPEHEVEVYMNAADVVVLPFQETLNSGSVILAMSFAKALITPDIGCIPETLDKKGSFIYDHNSISGLIDAMNAALEADLVLKGRQNYNKIKSKDWKKIARTTFNVYNQCITHK